MESDPGLIGAECRMVLGDILSFRGYFETTFVCFVVTINI